MAAGVVFYGLLALFPAVTAFVSLYGLFAKASTINDHLALVGGFLPAGGVDIIQEQVNRIAAKGEAKLGFAFAFGLALALWSANAGMKALIDALNVIYDEKEKRGFIKLNFVSLVLTAGGLLAILTAVGAIVVLPVVLSFVGLGGWTETLLRLLRWPVLVFVVIFGLAVLLSFRAEPRTPAMGMAFGGKRARGGRMAGEFGAAVMVLGELRQLRCDLRLARRCHRPDDVDVDVLHRDSVRRRAQLRDRAPDRPRFHYRRRTAARPAWRCHGGHRGRCGQLAQLRPQRG
ncbi:MAG: YihY/virulence factor BrkB family protein [Xanthobacteraceae bacterium]